MNTTQIRGLQLRLASLGRDRIDASFAADLAAIESNIASIFNTMSTDTERMAAMAALTEAFQNADVDLQTAINGMISALKAGAGLEADGTLVLPEGHNFLTGATSLKGAIGLLDAALKTEQGARVADVSALQSQLTTMSEAGAATAAADLAAAVAAQALTDAAQNTALTKEVARATAAEADLQTQVDNEVAARTALNNTLSTSIADNASAAAAATSSESTRAVGAETVLGNRIDAEALARTTADGQHTAAIAQEVADRAAGDAAETARAIAAEVALDTRVVVLESQVASNLTYDKRVTRETPAGSIDGVVVDFTLANVPAVGTEEVYLNGLLQDEGATNDYTIEGAVITFNAVATPQVGDKIRVSYFRK